MTHLQNAGGSFNGAHCAYVNYFFRHRSHWRLFPYLVALFVICTYPRLITAQERCNIPLPISPDIRGVRLGMKLEEVRAMFPKGVGFGFAPQPDEAGVIDSLDLGILDWYEQREKFKGVEDISLVFADGKLVKIGVSYEKTADWPNVDTFAAQVSSRLALPLAWRRPDNADPTIARVMDCDGFRVIAVAPGPAAKTFIGLVDTAAERAIKEKRAAIEEQKRRAFRP